MKVVVNRVDGFIEQFDNIECVILYPHALGSSQPFMVLHSKATDTEATIRYPLDEIDHARTWED